MADALDVWMVFQVVAATEDAAVDSLDQHVEKLASEDGVEIMEQAFDPVEQVDQPHPQLEEGYSRVCELDLTVATFDRLVELVVNYGPTAVDVTGPDEITLDLAEMQAALNLVASMMHQFLQAGIGGTIISREQEQ